MTDHHVPLSDLLKRWLTNPEQPALWLNTEASTVFSALSLDPTQHQHCHFHYAAHCQHQLLEIPAFSFAQPPQQPLDRVFWQWPKAKAEADMILAWLQSVMSNQSELWLAGHNRGGIRSAQTFLTQRGWSSQLIGKAKHCALIQAQPPEQRQPFELEHYWHSTAIPGHPELQQWSLPGTFSQGRIDHGSALLLPFLTQVQGPMVDFGCGSGVLSLVAQAHQPKLAITAVDHHWLAVLSTQQTAAQNGMSWQVLWRDELPDGPWQTIVSNPPFHSGINIQYEVTHRLLEQAQMSAATGGTLWLVVNDHLPYGDWLKAYTQDAVNTLQQGGYRVWRAQLQPKST
jgi:16S rRNA (guanine1207-N2)-methyltransferase